MKSVLLFSGAILCFCGSSAAQAPSDIPIVNHENAIAVSGVCMPAVSRAFGYLDAQQRPQIRVALWARPVAGASVEVYRAAKEDRARPRTKPILVLTSDQNGRVVLPLLDPGKYYVLGRSKPDREDDIYLEISPTGRKWNDLVLNLEPVRGSAEWALVSLATKQHVNEVSAFRGSVQDYGRSSPDAEIDVFAKQLGIDQQPIHLRADSKGDFSANLPDGQYAVHVMGNGMSDSLFWVNISPKATSGELQVKLCKVVTE